MPTTSAAKAPATVLVVFGASGDLTKRLLMPALYNLAGNHLLDEEFEVIGISRSAMSDAEFQGKQAEFMSTFTQQRSGDSSQKLDEVAWKWLEKRLSYTSASFTEDDTYQQLSKRLGKRNAVFFLAVPHEAFLPIVNGLHANGLMQQGKNTSRRVVIEKPFGHDHASAINLNQHMLGMFKEEQIYRIDHYLGKETVQNISALRFGNRLFESTWNGEHIESVQITAAETVGVEGRGSFYEPTGALRDMIVNHLFQVLSLITMEPPATKSADAIRTEKAKAIQSIVPLSETDLQHDVVRGQYTAGTVNGKDVPGYTQEDSVAPISGTETYLAMRLKLDTPRWKDVPFYLRTGKRLATRKTEIVITFKQPTTWTQDPVAANTLVLRLQPEEGITLFVNAKVPGQTQELQSVALDFGYKNAFELKPNTGYESLLYDVFIGDQTLYNRADIIEAGWEKIQPILDAVAQNKLKLHPYAAGSEGPQIADNLPCRSGHEWRKLV
ncbi:MAG: glucose-6-phosphate dehydrogenase [Blastochloris viridis]|uniref:Glucose-6-phosphate 1-dehydrogenase n=1 Tax=Blastochloris viridis TaxID=1079 RepID=A0A6N4RCA1_BLAVI|nr:MAG: glucose-6-phosphate dehydrogenase [Blastochloris viridis]